MIRPPVSDSVATYERVLRETGSMAKAVDAVAAAAVVYSRWSFGHPGAARRGCLSDIDRAQLPGLFVRVFCATHGIAVEDLLSGSRKRYVTRVRHEIEWVLSEKAAFTTREIAPAVGMEDHSAVAYGIEIMRVRLESERGLAEDINGLIERVLAIHRGKSTVAAPVLKAVA